MTCCSLWARRGETLTELKPAQGYPAGFMFHAGFGNGWCGSARRPACRGTGSASLPARGRRFSCRRQGARSAISPGPISMARPDVGKRMRLELPPSKRARSGLRGHGTRPIASSARTGPTTSYQRDRRCPAKWTGNRSDGRRPTGLADVMKRCRYDRHDGTIRRARSCSQGPMRLGNCVWDISHAGDLAH